jgi:hypothetical protein
MTAQIISLAAYRAAHTPAPAKLVIPVFAFRLVGIWFVPVLVGWEIA